MMLNKIAWAKKTDEEKAEIVCNTLSLVTHNGITKDDLLLMLDWCFHELYGCGEPCFGHKERCKCFKVFNGGEHHE